MTQQDALVLAFELALFAPTKEDQAKAGKLAHSMAATMPKADVDEAMARFVYNNENTKP